MTTPSEPLTTPCGQSLEPVDLLAEFIAQVERMDLLVASEEAEFLVAKARAAVAHARGNPLPLSKDMN